MLQISNQGVQTPTLLLLSHFVGKYECGIIYPVYSTPGVAVHNMGFEVYQSQVKFTHALGLTSVFQLLCKTTDKG